MQDNSLTLIFGFTILGILPDTQNIDIWVSIIFKSVSTIGILFGIFVTIKKKQKEEKEIIF